MWLTDKAGKILNTPMDLWNHFMDATRYANETLRATSAAPRIKSSAWVARAKHNRPL